MKAIYSTAKYYCINALLLCVISFAGCTQPKSAGDTLSKSDIPKLLEQGKTAYYNADYSKAKDAFKKCADEGNPQGQYWLGYTTMKAEGHYSDTDTLTMSKEEVNKYIYDLYKKSADQNDGDGFFGLAVCYANGVGVTNDMGKYHEYLDKSVELNSAFGKAYKGMAIIGKGGAENIQKGLALIKESAEAGNYIGKTKLAACYIDGVGVNKNSNKALELLCECAKHNTREANTLLAYLYFFGATDIQENKAKAFKYAQKGQADGITFYILSSCHYNGYGTEKNEGRAAAYAHMSAKCGYALGESWWASFCEDGYGTLEEAFDWYMKAADQDIVFATYAVGEFLLKGKAGRTDYATAKRYLQKAASMGSKEAQELLDTYQFELYNY